MTNTQVKKSPIPTILMHAFLILIAITMLVPFIWMILTAFKTQSEAMSIDPFVVFPKAIRWDAFLEVTRNFNFPRLYFNTLLMIFWRIVFAVVTSSMAGFAFGRLRFPGRDFAFTFVLMQMMVPSQIFVIPQYVMISQLNLTNTIFALLFPGLVSAFGTFLMRQTYRTLPLELEEAARLDGCNIGQVFLYVMAPLTKSTLIALSIFTAIFAYKDLLWPMIVNSQVQKMTLAPALSRLQGQFSTDYPELMAASLLACLPMLVLYLLFQRHFIEGIATTGGKL